MHTIGKQLIATVLVVVSLLFLSVSVSALPAKYFFKAPETVAARLSPTGDKVALLKNRDGSRLLVVQDLANDISRTLLNTGAYSEEESSIHSLLWLDNQYIAIQLVEIKSGIRDLLDSKIERSLLIIDTKGSAGDENLIRSVRTSGWLVSALPAKVGKFLFAKTGYQSRVYEIAVSGLAADKAVLGKLDKVDGGQFTRSNIVRTVKGVAIKWFIDGGDKPESVIYINRDKKIVLAEFEEDNSERIVKTWDLMDEDLELKYLPVARAGEKSTWYALDIDEEEERSVYRVNFETDEKTLVYETQAYKIIDLDVSADNKLLAVKVLNDGVVEYDYIDESGNTIESRSSEIYTSFDPSLDGQTSLVYSETHDQPGEFRVLGKRSNKSTVVGAFYPELRDKLNSKLISGEVEVDGLDIPWLLTVPDDADEHYPLIVMPHGGPMGVFDDRYYDPLTQFWAANGYAVLRVNFRGSGGHTSELREAGVGEWGGKMLDDVVAATTRVAGFSYISEKQICIVGISYGGYAAAMLTINNPELFNCGVAMAGVYDVNLRIRSPYANDEQVEWMKENIGDPESNFEELKQISPVYQVQSLQRPLLVVHGAKDKNVALEQARRILKMLEKYNKPHESYIDPDADHSFLGEESMSTVMEKARRFVEKNIVLAGQ